MKKISLYRLENIIFKNQYNRVVVTEDLNDIVRFSLYEDFAPDDLKRNCYIHEIVIDDRWQKYTKTQIKQKLKDFLEAIKSY